MVAKTADNLRFHHAKKQTAEAAHLCELHVSGGQLETSAQSRSQARMLAAAGCRRTTSTGLRQEVDIRYVVTSLKGSAQYLYEDVYCQRGQMENLIKLHKGPAGGSGPHVVSTARRPIRCGLPSHNRAFWFDAWACAPRFRRQTRSQKLSSRPFASALIKIARA